jgi:hypothetical protein
MLKAEVRAGAKMQTGQIENLISNAAKPSKNNICGLQASFSTVVYPTPSMELMSTMKHS